MDTETQGSADAGNPEVSNASTGQGSTPAANDWMSGLSEDNRPLVEAKGWKSVDDALKSYKGLESKFGEISSKALTLPGDDATSDDWAAFYGKLGRPETPDGYEFKLPEGVPENFPYDQNSALAFKAWAHGEGLSPKQAQGLHDHFVKHQATMQQAMVENETKAMQAAQEALNKAWGDPSSETHRRNQELANRTIRQHGGEALVKELQAINALGPNGEVRTPRLADMLAKIGAANFAEDTLFGGPVSEANPFSPKSENLTKQGEIIRSDPERARLMIRAAGQNPSDWML